MIEHPAFTVRSIQTIFLEEPQPLGAGTKTPFATTVTSFVSLLVRVEDTDGAIGWGEVWCNFPRFGGTYRARIVADLIAPLLIGTTVTSVPSTFADLDARLALAAAQSADRGAFAQALAGVDLALWDLAGKRAGQPLWRLLGGNEDEVGVYASLGTVQNAAPFIEQAQARGFQRFKVRLYGDALPQISVLAAARGQLGSEYGLAVDANQSWPVAQVAEIARRLSDLDLLWLEEPLPATAPPEAWARLAAVTTTPLAAGENLYGPAAFRPYLEARAFGICQPDPTKWGGISGVLPLAAAIRAAGGRFFPHNFAGAIGLVASAHLLIAAGNDGLLEYGAQPYPVALRDDLVPLPEVRQGRWRLADAPGLGVEPDPDIIRRFAVD